MEKTKKLTESPILQTSKNQKNPGKKSSKLFTKNQNFIFFEFFSENVVKTIQRGGETTTKKNSSFRDIFKIHDFF